MRRTKISFQSSAVTIIAVALLSLLTHLNAVANPALYDEARRLITAMNAKQAYMLLVAEQDKLAGNPEYDYLLGVAALDSGKIDDAIIAFERVLAVEPRNAGAQLDLARAYFNAGSLDLAEGTFRKLKASNPPAAALGAIDKYLNVIGERRKASRRIFNAWGEMTLGYDSNLTGVPTDFSAAVQQSFNLVGVNPTGNSIKRKAPYLGAAVGADFITPISEQWSGYVGGELHARGYRKEAEFNSYSGDARVGAIWDSGSNQLRFNAAYNRYAQEGDAPGDPKPTNDRRNANGGAEWRININAANQLSMGLNAGQTRFIKNPTEDFDSVMASAGWLTSFIGTGTPLLQFSGYYSRDTAQHKLADGLTDKSKKIAGVRVYGQYNLSDRLSLFSTLGHAQRRDDSAFARSTTVELGRDRLTDLTLGVNWRFQDRCSMRAQWAASRNDSNIAIYDYTRHEVSSTIRCDFR